MTSTTTAAPSTMLWRAIGAALLALAAAIAGGCGPSTGGTGTGASLFGLQFFNATPQSLCSAAVSTAVGCVATSPGIDRAPVYFASAAGDVRVTIDDDDIFVEAPCRGLLFEGTWATNATLGVRFYGAILVGSPITDLLPATVSAQPGATADILAITLRDATDSALIGPVDVQRQNTLPPPPSCR